LRRKTLELASDGHLHAFWDYCLYDFRPAGTSAVERAYARMKDKPESEEKTVLEAMTRARFTMLMVTGTRPGIGIDTLDLIQCCPCFVTDFGLSETALSGHIVVGRLVEFPQLRMTSGAALVFDETLALNAIRFATESLGKPVPDFLATARPKDKSRFATLILSHCFNQADGPVSSPEFEDPT
jgi:hypothetical protein